MPKMKTHSSSKKRFKKTASGKVKYSKAFKRHHAWAKDRKRIRNLGKAGYFIGTQKAIFDKLLPN